MLKRTFFFLILLSFLLCFVSLAQVRAQGINLDAVSSADTGASLLNSLTFSHTIGAAGTNRLLIVGVSIRNTGAGDTVNTVTYGGVGLTRAGFRANGNRSRVEIWRLVAPATGTNQCRCHADRGKYGCFCRRGSFIHGGESDGSLGHFFFGYRKQ